MRRPHLSPEANGKLIERRLLARRRLRNKARSTHGADHCPA